MGWKAVRDLYKIEHIVCVQDGLICIGSACDPALIAIDAEGSIVKRRLTSPNANLKRYMAEMDADPQALRDAVRTKDVFTASIPVYTYKGDQIIEAACEVLGWPSVTHDGDVMYDNTYSTDRDQVVRWAMANLKAAIRLTERELSQSRKDLDGLQSSLADLQACHSRLSAREPAASAVEDAQPAPRARG